LRELAISGVILIVAGLIFAFIPLHQQYQVRVPISCVDVRAAGSMENYPLGSN
jgi:hypothetical protein